MCRKVLLLLKCMIMFCVWSIRYKMGYRQPREIHYELTPATRHRQVSVFQLAFAIVVGTITLAAILLALCVIWYVDLSRNVRYTKLQQYLEKREVRYSGFKSTDTIVREYWAKGPLIQFSPALDLRVNTGIVTDSRSREIDTIFCNFYLFKFRIGWKRSFCLEQASWPEQHTKYWSEGPNMTLSHLGIFGSFMLAI